MKLLFPFLLLLLFTTTTHAQKPILDSQAIAQWPSISWTPALSDDGCYLLYTITHMDKSSLVIQKTDNSWQQTFTGVMAGAFIAGRQVVFQRNDTLFFFSLLSRELTYVVKVMGYKLSKDGDGSWITYRLTGPANELVLQNLLTGKKRRFAGIITYTFNDKAMVLVLQTVDAVQWVDLKNDKLSQVFSATSEYAGKTLSSYVLDATGTQLALILQQKDSTGTTNTLWYYKRGTTKAIMMAETGASGIAQDLSISNAAPSYSPDGRYLFFNLVAPADSSKPASDAVKVDVWSYKDSVLQSTQLLALHNPPHEYTAVIDIASRRINQLCHQDERLLTKPTAKGDFAVIMGKYSIGEYWWKSFPEKPFYLVSLKDGSRRPLKVYPRDAFFRFSPTGKYLVYHDAKDEVYYSYNVNSGQVINISNGIPFPITSRDESMNEEIDSLRIPIVPLGIAGWLPDDAALLIYDNYDIWEVDPSGKKSPMNITNGYGRQHHIKLKIISPPTFKPLVFRNNELLLLTAFSTQNKYNGFYHKALNKNGNPELLCMGPYHMYTASAFQTAGDILNNISPVKAKDKDCWVLIRQTATDAPNYFITQDFKKFTRLTNIQPQEKYNWLTTELVSFKQLDGTPSQGILFKPENFDSTKKYPVIFYYYDKLSPYRYQYFEPDFSNGAINIPWFVSRGYLVFTPDIHFTISKTGESVCNAVVAAAQHLAQISWVNDKAMAIAGHSFGGYETNYLVTHSKLFAAAVTAAGMSDFVSVYGGLGVDAMGATSRQEECELSVYRLWYTLWDRPDVYINNSPIFSINQVTCPLLIVHHKKDVLVPWDQSVELFNGLRRLQKKAWMLQYDEGAHGVGGKEAWDLTKRITQFFDHYLKGALPPVWMTEGIPAREKGIVTGYEPDVSGKKP